MKPPGSSPGPGGTLPILQKPLELAHTPLGSPVNRGQGAPNDALTDLDLRCRKVRQVPGSSHPWLPTH